MIKRRLVWIVVLLLSLVACYDDSFEQTAPILGEKTQSIIGGSPDSRYPAIGALTVNKSGSFCTGTLVSPTFVLTAGHCVVAARGYIKKNAKIFFRIDLPSGTTTKVEYHESSGNVLHPKYGSSGNIALSDDFGGLVLKTAVVSTPPLPLHFRPPMSSTWVGRKFLFLGYGLIKTQPVVGAKVKHGVELPVTRVFSDRFEVYESKKSICSGDSGGPALFQVGGKLRVVGVNSYVTGTRTGSQSNCDAAGFGFRVDVYGDWLQPILNNNNYTCLSDDDCGGCFGCSASTRKCVPKVPQSQATNCKPCRSPADCGGGTSICVRTAMGNRCMQACDAFGCCPSGYSCQPISKSTKQCMPIGDLCPDLACQTASQCGPGEECFQSKCRPVPVKPIAQLCQKCQTDKDCGMGRCRRYLEGGYCVQSCVADNFCPPDYQCQIVDGMGRQCVPVKGFCTCKDNSTCHPGYTCIGGSCRVVGGAKYGNACDLGIHLCAPTYACLNTSADPLDSCFKVCQSPLFPPGSPGSVCRPGDICDQGSNCVQLTQASKGCAKYCNQDEDCLSGGKCYPQNTQNVCFCRSDSECKPGYGCNKTLLGQVGFCAKKLNSGPVACPTNFQCKELVTGFKVCQAGPSQKAGEPCDNIRACVAGLLCLRSTAGGSFCFPECSNSGKCEGGAACVTASAKKACICNNQMRCAQGYSCKVSISTLGVCEKGDTCEVDTQCPKAHLCSNKKCVPGCRIEKDCPFKFTCKSSKCVPILPPEPSPSEKVSPDAGQEKNPSIESSTSESSSPEPVNETSSESKREEPTTHTDASGPERPAEPVVTPEKNNGIEEHVPVKGSCGCQSEPSQPGLPLFWIFFFLPLLLGRCFPQKNDVDGFFPHSQKLSK